MKITINLSKKELKDIVAQRLGLNDDFDLVLTVGIDDETTRAFNRVESLIKSGQKIAAIKELRTAAPQYSGDYGMTSRMGLKAAKDSVEDWENYKTACEVAGKMILDYKN